MSAPSHEEIERAMREWQLEYTKRIAPVTALMADMFEETLENKIRKIVREEMARK